MQVIPGNLAALAEAGVIFRKGCDVDTNLPAMLERRYLAHCDAVGRIIAGGLSGAGTWADIDRGINLYFSIVGQEADGSIDAGQPNLGYQTIQPSKPSP